MLWLLWPHVCEVRGWVTCTYLCLLFNLNQKQKAHTLLPFLMSGASWQYKKWANKTTLSFHFLSSAVLRIAAALSFASCSSIDALFCTYDNKQIWVGFELAAVLKSMCKGFDYSAEKAAVNVKSEWMCSRMPWSPYLWCLWGLWWRCNMHQKQPSPML